MSRKNKKIFFTGGAVIFLLVVAAFLRFYNLGNLLGFWYDQGRDALVIWDMLYKGKFTLIGPQMGFTGIFRGGWYYWIIAPFYYISRGNPILPNVFLIITSIVAVYLLFVLSQKMDKPKAGLLAMLIASVSIYVIGASRWLSDPTPTLLVSTILVFSLFKYSEGKTMWLAVAGLLSGMAMQFSAAAEIFYIPAIVFLVIVLRKKVKPGIKHIFLSVSAYCIAFIPQMVFEIRHPGVQTGAFYNFIFNEKTFTYAFWEIIKTRLPFDYQMFASKFWINGSEIFAPFFLFFVIVLALNWKNLWSSDKFKIIFALSISPLIGTLFFVSNLGGVYEYYFTGYYLIWILLFSYVYMFSAKNIFAKVLIGIFITLLLCLNLNTYKKDYFIDVKKSENTIFVNELSAIDWIYRSANSRDFNVDVYVPPVIPYAYDYLFQWLGREKYNSLPQENQVSLLYTLYEADKPHPERLQAWLDRQKGIGVVLDEEKFGSITVQERQRITK